MGIVLSEEMPGMTNRKPGIKRYIGITSAMLGLDFLTALFIEEHTLVVVEIMFFVIIIKIVIDGVLFVRLGSPSWYGPELQFRSDISVYPISTLVAVPICLTINNGYMSVARYFSLTPWSVVVVYILISMVFLGIAWLLLYCDVVGRYERYKTDNDKEYTPNKVCEEL